MKNRITVALAVSLVLAAGGCNLPTPDDDDVTVCVDDAIVAGDLRVPHGVTKTGSGSSTKKTDKKTKTVKPPSSAPRNPHADSWHDHDDLDDILDDDDC